MSEHVRRILVIGIIVLAAVQLVTVYWAGDLGAALGYLAFASPRRGWPDQ